MASAFLTLVSSTVRAVREGVADAAPEIGIDTSDSDSVESASYNVISGELSIQFRRRRRKIYVYPMPPTRAAAFAAARSKGRFLRDISQ